MENLWYSNIENKIKNIVQMTSQLPDLIANLS